MVQQVSHSHGTDLGHSHQTSTGVPSVYYMSGTTDGQDTFHAAHQVQGTPHHGNFFQRVWHRMTRPVVQMFKDAAALPKTVWNKLFHKDHGAGGEGPPIPFIASQGVLSGNLWDETVPNIPEDNPYMAKTGFLSGDPIDESVDNYVTMPPSPILGTTHSLDGYHHTPRHRGFFYPDGTPNHYNSRKFHP